MRLEIAIEIADRLCQPVPDRLKFAAALQGPVHLFEPHTGFSPIGHLQESIYSANCVTEVILPQAGIGTRPLVICDLRMTEVALDLIVASLQDSQEAETALMHLIISRLVLEQSLAFTPGIFHAGLMLDRIALEASNEVLQRRGTLKYVDIGEASLRFHVEQITQFCLVHEVTHYCLFADGLFRNRWVEYTKDIVISACRALEISFNDEYTKDAFARCKEDATRCDSGTLLNYPDFEEHVCDLSAVISLVNAIEENGTLATGQDGLMLSLLASLSATWLVAAIRGVVRSLMTTASGDLRRFHPILFVRGGVASVTVTQLIGKRLGLDAEQLKTGAGASWRRQPDFEGMILTILNQFFSSDHLERILAMGHSALSTGMCSEASAEAAIRAHFGWS